MNRDNRFLTHPPLSELRYPLSALCPIVLLYLVFFMLACAGTPHKSASTASKKSEKSKENQAKSTIHTPHPSANMVDGPDVHSSNALLAWLENNAKTTTGKRKRFRLPLVVRFEDLYQLAIATACIGTSEKDLDVSCIKIQIDDTAMATSFLSQLPSDCPQLTRVCRLWIEGYWGLLVTLPTPTNAKHNTIYPFAVLKVIGTL